MKYLLGLALCLASCTSVWAQADDAVLGDEKIVKKTRVVEEVRAGVAVHDLGWSIINADGDEEKSIALNAEIIFAEPEFLKWALSPQPYIGGTLNVEGKTSYGGAGLLWRQNLGERFYGDFAFGVVVHDGFLNFEEIDDSTSNLRDFIQTANSSNVYGSRVLFRQQLTLGLNLSEDWAAEGFVEHISHGGLLSDGPNEGSDAAGFRLNRKF
jgi:hypothetical protein